MTAWIIDERGYGHILKTRRRSAFEAFCDLCERVSGSIEIRRWGAEREPREVTAEWLMANCREVTIY